MRSSICPACGQQNSEFNVDCSACGASLFEVPPAAPGVPASAVGQPLAPADAAPGSAALVGRQIADYQVLSRLGGGGMGSIYRARNRRTGEMAALKTLRLPAEALMPRIRREIQALARIRHPGIVRILDHGTLDGVPWYAMQLLEGPTLHGVAHASPRSGVNGLLSLVGKLCSALAYLHGEGLIHRDLTPGNIVVTAPWQPVLVDFGLACESSGAAGRETLTAETGPAGTLLYMAPEQIRGELLDARADLYALGCILYELLTGQPPFPGPAPELVVQGHLRRPALPPSRLAPGLSVALDELVLRLLAKSPRDRLGHADDVAAALARIATEQGAPLEAGGDPVPSPPRPRPYLYRPGFSGRQQALHQLRESLDRLESSGGGLALIGGESGAGKTRLALQVAREASRLRIRVLAGECLPGAAGGTRNAASPGGAGGAPLQGLRGPLQAIADRCGELGLPETQRLLGPRGRVLAMYEPALADLPGLQSYPAPAELPAPDARLRLYSDLIETLGALASTGPQDRAPLLLILDDLQWADELTLGFLDFCLRTGQLARRPILVLGTYRSEEVGVSLAGAGTQASPLRRLIDSSATLHLQLDRLDEVSIGAMVGDMLALTSPPEPFVRSLTRHSEGNPFFVAEYLRASVEAGFLWRDQAGCWRVEEHPTHPSEARGRDLREGSGLRVTVPAYASLPLPTTLRDLIGRRLEGISALALRLLDVAAVLGRETSSKLLAIASGLAGTSLLQALDELVQRQVLEEGTARPVAAPSEAPSRLASLRFTHDQVREVAYARIAGPSRQTLHRAAAEAIEAHFAPRLDEHLAALGRHWEQAGEAPAAARFHLAAARHAKDRHALDEAEQLYRAHLRLVQGPTEASIAVRNELGQEVLARQGRASEAIVEHTQSLAEARLLASLAAEGHSLQSLATAHWELGQIESARGFFDQALAALRSTGDRRREAMVLNSLATLASDRGAPRQARGMYEQALGIARTLADRSLEAIILQNLAMQLGEQGESQVALELYTQALAILRETGSRLNEGKVLGNLARHYETQGSLDLTRSLLHQALAIHREIGNRRSEALALSNLGGLELALGHLETAHSCLQQALAIHREVGNRRTEGLTLCSLAQLEVARGRPDDAHSLYQQALELHRATEDRWSEGMSTVYLASLQRRVGKLAEAHASLEQAGAILRPLESANHIGLLLCEQGHLDLANAQSAEASLAEARALAERLQAGPASELGQAIGRLERACQAVAQGQPLLHGECDQDLPEGLRQAGIAGQLAAADGF